MSFTWLYVTTRCEFCENLWSDIPTTFYLTQAFQTHNQCTQQTGSQQVCWRRTFCDPNYHFKTFRIRLSLSTDSKTKTKKKYISIYMMWQVQHVRHTRIKTKQGISFVMFQSLMSPHLRWLITGKPELLNFCELCSETVWSGTFHKFNLSLYDACLC